MSKCVGGNTQLEQAIYLLNKVDKIGLSHFEICDSVGGIENVEIEIANFLRSGSMRGPLVDLSSKNSDLEKWTKLLKKFREAIVNESAARNHESMVFSECCEELKFSSGDRFEVELRLKARICDAYLKGDSCE